jgi:hypothetical protein
MSVDQRQHQPFLPRGWRSRVRAVAATMPEMRAHPAAPTIAPATEDPSILGFPAEAGEEDDGETGEVALTVHRAVHDGRLVVARRADRIGGTLLVLAGVAAGMSLWFPWVRGDGFTGLSLVTGGLALLLAPGGPGPDSVSWQPVAVVLGGGALLLLGVLLFLPAATHRLVGLLAFTVAEIAAAGLLTPLAASGWSVARFDVGMWCAVAVPVLGVLGALKAMLTGPRLLSEHAGPGPAPGQPAEPNG